MRAVLDIGSNTVRLLVARVKDGRVETVRDESDFVRLGRDVDRTGLLQPDREDAALEAIERLSAVALGLGAERIEGIATSAVREARNGEAFVRRVRRTTGIDVQIISGEREAYLTFLGATAGMSLAGGIIVADLGGGSTELIAAVTDGVRWAVSVPLGSGRLTERYIRCDPPSESNLEALRKAVRQDLDKLASFHPQRAVFTGGTASALARLAGHEAPEATLNREAVREAVRLATSRPSSEIAAEYGVRPERAAVLAAGVTALDEIAAYYDVREVVITRGGIREGALIAASWTDSPQRSSGAPET